MSQKISELYAKKMLQELAAVSKGLAKKCSGYDSKSMQVRRFFDALRPQYLHRRKYEDNYVEGSNIFIPQMDVTVEVMPDIFSYSGYNEIDNLRDHNENNRVISKMIDESLEEAPAIIVDLGTYDGKRTRDVISNLKNKKEVFYLVGIDINPIVQTAFDGLEDCDHAAINMRIENVLPYLKEVPMRKIYLGLENIIMNIGRRTGCNHQGIQGIISKMLNHGDELVFEVLDYYDPKNYADGVERVIYNYYETSGLKNILGGNLHSEAEYNEQFRITFIENMKDLVKYDGMTFDFRNKPHTINTAGGPMELDCLLNPMIHICVSAALEEDGRFAFLFMNFLNNVVLEKESNWISQNGRSIVKFRKRDNERISDTQLHNIMFRQVDELPRGITPPMRNYSDVMLGLGQYPSHYNKFLTEWDEMLQENPSNPNELSNEVKYFLRQRIGYDDFGLQNNMNRYMIELVHGCAPDIDFTPKNPFDGISVISFMELKRPY